LKQLSSSRRSRTERQQGQIESWRRIQRKESEQDEQVWRLQKALPLRNINKKIEKRRIAPAKKREAAVRLAGPKVNEVTLSNSNCRLGNGAR